MVRFPSIVKCPYCHRKFQKSLSRRCGHKYQIICPFCHRKFHIWEAKLYDFEGTPAIIKEVTPKYKKIMKYIKKKSLN